jgi:hypothetical protein
VLEVLSFRVTAEEKARLAARAERAGISLSDLLRSLVLPIDAEIQVAS